MSHKIQDIVDYHKDDTLIIETTVRNDDEEIVDLTGAAAQWLMKNEAEDPDGDALLTKTVGEGITIDQPTAGKLEIKIEEDEADTVGSFHHRLRVWDNDGHRSTVFTGSLTVEE